MKQLCARLLVIAVLGSLLANAGCVLNGTDVVITDAVCVDIDEVQTTGSFSTFVVTDQFKAAFDKKLKENGKTTVDVKSIHMVSATFKTTLVKPHDWNVTATIDIARQDTPGGAYDDGPAPLVSFSDQSLTALRGSPTDATLSADGVALVDRALASLVAGQNPRLVLIVNNENVTPTPSIADPMAFKVKTCVTFQAVVNGTKK
jgi:uncharacterized glyoxalase superfamily protein PhnB